jgi:hypothetical protein
MRAVSLLSLAPLLVLSMADTCGPIGALEPALAPGKAKRTKP